MRERPYFLRFAALIALGSSSPAIERTIDEATARKLVEEALPALGENRASVEIGPWRYYWAPEFYTFSAWRAGDRGVLITHYLAVNPWTGDVWDAIGCKRLSSPGAQKVQDEVWKRSGIPAEARDAMRNRSPADCASVMKLDKKP